MADVLYLIRHGELPEEYQGRYVGRTDAPLSEAGRRWMRSLPLPLLDVVYCSPLRRARESAACLQCTRVIPDERLAEVNFGEWDNRTFEEIAAVATAEQLECWSRTPDAMVFPGGESVAEFRARIADFQQDFQRRESGPGTAGVVTHGGVLMYWLAGLRGIPESRLLEARVPRGGWVKLQRTQGGVWHEA